MPTSVTPKRNGLPLAKMFHLDPTTLPSRRVADQGSKPPTARPVNQDDGPEAASRSQLRALGISRQRSHSDVCARARFREPSDTWGRFTTTKRATRPLGTGSHFGACGRLASGMDRLLSELDGVIPALTVRHGGRDPEVIRLTGLYHSLLRKWGDL